MNAAVQSSRHVISPLVILLAAATLVVGACASPAGPLGTPASPVTSAAGSGEPVPSDVAPASASASVEPSASPSDEASADPSSEAPASPSHKASPSPAPTASPSATVIVRAYFMLGSKIDNPGLVPVLRVVPETKALARAAMTALLAGPKGAELNGSPAMYSSIPDGTTLLDLAVSDKVATVILSDDFAGASRTFQAAVARAQVAYTLTQFSSIHSVRIGVGDTGPEPAVTRADFQEQSVLPAIFVDRPAWGAAAGNPVTVSGIANVFEATFRVQVLDAKDNVIADEQVHASCGTGCWGTFKKSLAYTVTKGQYGTLRVFDYSPKDGSPENVTDYRVWLTP